MFDFGNANEGQRVAISTVDGPVLITAGPGTGKTYTLVQRAIYLIEERGVKPENIMIATFTEKAAKELITRITNELDARHIIANINEMYIGTFHSICLRILKEHLEYTRLGKNYRMLDAFDQFYMVFQNINRFRSIPNIEMLFKNKIANQQAKTICTYVGSMIEELVSADALIQDSDLAVSTAGRMLKEYEKLLVEENLMDFSSIQVEAYKLLKDHPNVLEEIQSQITHIMVDEYQDTNYIQELLVFLLAGERKNICVVGDDDQGLYRFRGATIRNILEFPHKFSEGACKVIPLVVNYRSNKDIVDFYNKWMHTTSGKGYHFEWDKFRYAKKIIANKKKTFNSPAVAVLSSNKGEEAWHETILRFIHDLKESGKLQNYNQIAFLFQSVTSQKVIDLANFLERHHIHVYSPRSGMFFKREEIKMALGCFMLLFPNYVNGLIHNEYIFVKDYLRQYYLSCIQTARSYLGNPKYRELSQWIQAAAYKHQNLKGTTNYGYGGLLYLMLQFEPFASILDVKMDSGVVDTRPARNLATLTSILGKFEYLHHVDVLDGKIYQGERRIVKNTELLFNMYLNLQYKEHVGEYEDDSEYAPSGCVSFLTIHQAKGMEFPIVIVDSLGNGPKDDSSSKDPAKIMDKIESKYYHRPAFEPDELKKFFDFWRLFYTAFSRAQDLLLLSCSEVNQGTTKPVPSKFFHECYSSLNSVYNPEFHLEDFDFEPVKNVNIKNSYSFTSDVTVYETCARQYKFYKELAFAPVRGNAMLFGTLVHETIEDVHKAAMRHEEDTINENNITSWFEANYTTLSQNDHVYLAPPQKEAALRQVLAYVDRQHGDWSMIQQAEVDVSLVKPTYILEGKIDLIRGEGDTVEIVDFKSEPKPDLSVEPEKINRYKRQLEIYAYLVEQRTGKKVSKMHLYYTAEENGTPTITFPYKKEEIDNTMKVFDQTVANILAKNFYKCADNKKVCKSCDFQYYCQKRGIRI